MFILFNKIMDFSNYFHSNRDNGKRQGVHIDVINQAKCM